MFTMLVKRLPCKTEILVVGSVLSVLVLLPVLAVTTLLTTGIGAVSSSLVSEDATTHEVTLFNPDGSVRLQFEASTIWPVHGIVTTEFGADDLPYQAHHTGIDIAVPIGTSVVDFMNGTIVKTGYDASEGNLVYVDHGNGIVSHYLHLSMVTAVVGTHISAGTVIGLSGSTGYSTGPHVHFEVRVASIPVNPRELEVGSP